MIIADLDEDRRPPLSGAAATQNLVGGVSPIQARISASGNVTLDPNGGQVPWHNQEQEEVYFVLEGTGEMCLGDERQIVTAGQAVYIPPGVFHQLTNIGDTPLRMLYCYGPAGDVAHWKQELERHAAQRRRRGPAASARRLAAMHGNAREDSPTKPGRPSHSRQSMSIHDAFTIGIIMNGVTGRMGTNQHLMRSIVAIIQQGGVKVGEYRSRSCPIRSSSAATRPSWRSSPNRRASPAGPRISTRRWPIRAYTVYFDAQTTDRRVAAVDEGHRRRQAHLLREADGDQPRPRRWNSTGSPRQAGVKNGVVQDKLWLPGLLKLKLLRDTGFFGRILSRPRRVRLLGLRGRYDARPAPVVELPQGRRRRHHPRHALPLPLRARQSLRRRAGRLLPRRDAHRQALGRKRPALRLHGRRRRLRHVRT